MYINVITPRKITKSPIRCQSLLKLRNTNDHVVIHFASNFRVYSYRMTLNWLNRLAESRGLSIKVYLNEVYVDMFHAAEPCTMEIDVFHILHNYSNIVSFGCNFQTNRGIYIWCKWMPNSYSWRAHTSSYSAYAFMNINGYTKQLADTETNCITCTFI